MRLRDIVEGKEFPKIMYRCNPPEGIDKEDCLVGYCHYTNGQLIPDDGDDYSLDDEIEKYEIDDWGLVVWIHAEWMSSDWSDIEYI